MLSTNPPAATARSAATLVAGLPQPLTKVRPSDARSAPASPARSNALEPGSALPRTQTCDRRVNVIVKVKGGFGEPWFKGSRHPLDVGATGVARREVCFGRYAESRRQRSSEGETHDARLRCLALTALGCSPRTAARSKCDVPRTVHWNQDGSARRLLRPLQTHCQSDASASSGPDRNSKLPECACMPRQAQPFQLLRALCRLRSLLPSTGERAFPSFGLEEPHH